MLKKEAPARSYQIRPSDSERRERRSCPDSYKKEPHRKRQNVRTDQKTLFAALCVK